MTTYTVRIEWRSRSGDAFSTIATRATVEAHSRDMAVAQAMRRPVNRTSDAWELERVECEEITRKEAA